MRWCRSISMRGMSPARLSDLPRRWPAWPCHPRPAQLLQQLACHSPFVACLHIALRRYMELSMDELEWASAAPVKDMGQERGKNRGSQTRRAGHRSCGHAKRGRAHGGEFTEESLEALHALQEAWAAEQPGPTSTLKSPRARAKRRPRSAPPAAPPSQQEHVVVAKDYDSAPAQKLTWKEINALQGRACLTERHIPSSNLPSYVGRASPPNVGGKRICWHGALPS